MIKHLCKLFIICTAILLTACSFLTHKRDTEYLSAESIPPLKIPADVSAKSFKSEYPVVNHYYPDKIKETSITPPGLNS